MSDLRLLAPAKRKAFGSISTMDNQALERYASGYNAEELRQARELWRKYASRKELLDDGPEQKRYKFMARTLVYFELRKDGKRYPIPATSMRNDIDRFVGGVQQELRMLAAQLAAGQITAQQWYDESARLMKLSYRDTVDVARGKHTEMTSEEKQHYIEAILLLLLLLNKFAHEVETGIIIDGKFLHRAGMYGLNGRALYENWRLWSAVVNGNTEARRVLHPADHCTASADRPGCIELAAKGWMPISQMVPIGGATCYSGCQCTLEFR